MGHKYRNHTRLTLVERGESFADDRAGFRFRFGDASGVALVLARDQQIPGLDRFFRRIDLAVSVGAQSHHQSEGGSGGAFDIHIAQLLGVERNFVDDSAHAKIAGLLCELNLDQGYPSLRSGDGRWMGMNYDNVAAL